MKHCLFGYLIAETGFEDLAVRRKWNGIHDLNKVWASRPFVRHALRVLVQVFCTHLGIGQQFGKTNWKLAFETLEPIVLRVRLPP